MEFEYTPEQLQLRKAVREFAEAEIAPHVMEWDEAQTFPLEVVRKLGQLGYMGSIFPEDLGGAGLGYIEYSIIIEELSRVVADDDENHYALFFLGSALMEVGESARALKAFVSALQLEPDYPGALIGAGWALHALGRFR